MNILDLRKGNPFFFFLIIKQLLLQHNKHPTVPNISGNLRDFTLLKLMLWGVKYNKIIILYMSKLQRKPKRREISLGWEYLITSCFLPNYHFTINLILPSYTKKMIQLVYDIYIYIYLYNFLKYVYTQQPNSVFLLFFLPESMTFLQFKKRMMN